MHFLPVRSHKSGYKMAEIFAGTARLAAAFASLGIEAWAWDILYGEGADLLKESVLKDLKTRISAEEFRVVTFEHLTAFALSVGWLSQLR